MVMAMSYIQPILLVLVSLSLLPVLLGEQKVQNLDFKNCDRDVTDYGDINSVEVYKESVSGFALRVRGVAKKNIPGRNGYVFVNIHPPWSPEFVNNFYMLCFAGQSCKDHVLEAGEFVWNLRGIRSVGATRTLDTKYSVSLKTILGKVRIPTTLMCVDFKVNFSSLAFPSAITFPSVIKLPSA